MAAMRTQRDHLMASAQTPQPRDTMNALSLFTVLALAKIAALWGREIPLSAWTLSAYLWQDALIALAFGTFARAVKRSWINWAIYGAIVLYAAINIPLMRMLSTPMTWPMARAARGTLLDSIKHHLTTENLLIIVALLVVAFLLALLARKVSRQPKLQVLGIALPLALIVSGPFALTRVDTGGLHRNAVVALVVSA